MIFGDQVTIPAATRNTEDKTNGNDCGIIEVTLQTKIDG